MNKIMFSHKYQKLKNIQKDKPVVLIDVMSIELSQLSKYFIEYDTMFYSNGQKDNYPLKDGKYLLLFFVDKGLSLFTTIRRETESKKKYYVENIGYEFEVVEG